MVVLCLLVVVGRLRLVVLGWQWLWIVPLIDGVFFLGSRMYYFIVVNILFYCDIYIILFC